MRLVVIESPYAGDVPRNMLYARQAMRDSLQRGEAPFASHLLYTQPGVLDDAKLEERMLGITCGLAWARKAGLSVFYTDLGWSNGMLAALHDFNLKHNYPFRIRALNGPAKLPTTLDEDIERLLRAYVEE